jgi:hypothetical protein
MLRGAAATSAASTQSSKATGYHLLYPTHREGYAAMLDTTS